MPKSSRDIPRKPISDSLEKSQFNPIQTMGEQSLIKFIRQKWGKTAADLPVGIGDDAAVFDLDSQRKGLATSDLLIEDVHFKRAWTSPEQLGHKAMAVNLSDIAAMGGIPRFALVSLALPSQLPLIWLDEFYQGMVRLADKYNVVIAGGDTSSSPDRVIINITLLGEVPAQELLLRSGAKVEDKILVTGSLGNATAGLAILQSDLATPNDSFLLNKQLQPDPRCQEARVIAKKKLVSAMMDLSDGLATDIINLTQMSQVGARIYTQLIPLSKELKNRATYLDKSARDFALCGGEDYELLLTAPAKAVVSLQQALPDCPLTIIGEIIAQNEGLQLIDEQHISRPWPKGFQHFA